MERMHVVDPDDCRMFVQRVKHVKKQWRWLRNMIIP